MGDRMDWYDDERVLATAMADSGVVEKVTKPGGRVVFIATLPEPCGDVKKVSVAMVGAFSDFWEARMLHHLALDCRLVGFDVLTGRGIA